MLTLGSKFDVSINGRPQLRGRVELSDVPLTASDGSMVSFTIRTKLADAYYASADPSVRVTAGSTLKEFVLAVFAPLGFAETDFVFDSSASRNLLTGKNKFAPTPVDIEVIDVEKAKVAPPETIYAAVDKHLARHGLMMWDSPDGRIVIGAPNDEQDPLYTFRAYNDIRSQQNNILSARRTQDASQAPSSITVVGAQASSAWTQAKIRASKKFDELHALDSGAGLPIFHPVYILDSGVTSIAFAERRVRQETTARMMNFDAWTIEAEGFSYRSGGAPVVYGLDTVASVETSLIGGPAGAYLVRAVRKVRDVGGDKTELQLVKRGVWRL
jgi:hypothetical protein